VRLAAIRALGSLHAALADRPGRPFESLRATAAPGGAAAGVLRDFRRVRMGVGMAVRLAWESAYVQALAGCLTRGGEEGGEMVRGAALEALTAWAMPGDRGLLAALVAALVHASAAVRACAAGAVVALSGGGEEALEANLAALVGFVGTLQEPAAARARKVLRRGELARLLRAAERAGDDALQDALRDETIALDRELAATAHGAAERAATSGKIQTVMGVMRRVAPRGHLPSVRAVCACLSDPSFDVRANAVACLGCLCDADSSEALREVAGLLRSDEIHCRWAAAQALTSLARKGDRELLAEVLPVLQSEDRFMRQDAAGAMFGILNEADFPAIVEAMGGSPDQARQ
jgi:hypothetical protein